MVLAELYRRQDGWNTRAAGQGYATGLAGLATDYGVDIDTGPEPAAAPLPAQTSTTGPRAASVDLAKLERQAPGMLAPARRTSQALPDRVLAGRPTPGRTSARSSPKGPVRGKCSCASSSTAARACPAPPAHATLRDTAFYGPHHHEPPPNSAR
ncbi:TerD family protein [Streptomyces mutabilis]|uniref:TerD family protein n=1 Tax=Streptomyces mutabilis TaxID=67332 RepID=UPI0034DE4465